VAARRTSEVLKLKIIDEALRGHRASQRDLAKRLNISVAFLNRYLRELEAAGCLTVVDRGVRPFLYSVTQTGRRFRRQLIYRRYNQIVGRFHQLERRICARLAKLKTSGVTRVVCYGTGDIVKVTHRCAEAVGLEVVGTLSSEIDGNTGKSMRLRPPQSAAFELFSADAVLIAVPNLRIKLNRATSLAVAEEANTK
jgi:predicted transcriptional regulator